MSDNTVRHDDLTQHRKEASRLETPAEATESSGREATLSQLLEPFDESDRVLLGRVLKKAADKDMSARDLLHLYLSIDRQEGQKGQCGMTFHDTDGYKGLAEAYLD